MWGIPGPGAGVPPKTYIDLVPKDADRRAHCPTCGEWIGGIQWFSYGGEWSRAMTPSMCIFDLVKEASRA